MPVLICFITHLGLKCEKRKETWKRKNFFVAVHGHNKRGRCKQSKIKRLVPTRVLVPAKHAHAITRLYQVTLSDLGSANQSTEQARGKL